MSRLTSQEIIDQGTYLEPFFDPSSLLVANLRAVLQNHAVHFPANATKPALIKLFNEKIAPNAQEFKRQKKLAAGIPSDASDIMDGETGAYLEPKPIAERVGRRSTRGTAATSANASPVRNPSPSKRRRTIGVTQKRGTASDTEEEDAVPKERSRNKDATPTSDRTARRISRKWGPGDETSLWTDDNPFQSSSPIKQERRRSISPRKPRKSTRVSTASKVLMAKPPTDEEPENSIPTAKSKTSTSKRLSETFPPLTTHQHPSRSLTPITSPSVKVEESGDESLKVDNMGQDESDDVAASQELADAKAAEYTNAQIAKKIATLARDTPRDDITVSQFPTWLRFLLGLIGVIALALVGQYKNDSTSIGYCDTGKLTNSKVQARLELQQAIKECQDKLMQNSTDGVVHHEQDSYCSEIVPFVSLPRPTACTPCPEHAKCSSRSIVCEPAYMLRYHPLAKVPLLSGACNGLPGFGPIAFPSSCIPDSRRRKNVGAMGRGIESVLARIRGDRICSGVKGPKPGQTSAAAFGLSLEELRNEMIHRARVGRNLGDFEDIFGQALGELKSGSLVITSKDSQNAYYASIREEMTYGCKARVLARDAWDAYKVTVLYLIFALVLIAIGRSKFTARTIQNRRVRLLVKEALDTLQAKEAEHFLDPVQNPSPSIASLQLRDLVMQDEHSIPARTRIWEQVEKVVEGNANVRTNMEVISSGDEGRVWTWIGSAGARDRRIKFTEAQQAGKRPVV